MFIKKSVMLLSVLIQANSSPPFSAGHLLDIKLVTKRGVRKVIATGKTQLSYSSYQSPQGQQEWINRIIGTCNLLLLSSLSEQERNQHPFFFHFTTHTSISCPQRTFSSFKFQGFETFATISYNLHSSSYLLRTTTTTLLRCCCGVHP